MVSFVEEQLMSLPPLDVPVELGSSLLHERANGHHAVPALHLNTVQHRQRIPTASQITFRVTLLCALRSGWKDEKTEAKFLDAVDMIESHGCAPFGGLIDPYIFEQLVAEYDKILLKSGNKTFMRSYVNLANEIDFLVGGNMLMLWPPPLLIALISYLMGGPIRMVDFRGKNTDPISFNAQDNMLHVYNTPFQGTI
jgi:hypothetical protein